MLFSFIYPSLAFFYFKKHLIETQRNSNPMKKETVSTNTARNRLISIFVTFNLWLWISRVSTALDRPLCQIDQEAKSDFTTKTETPLNFFVLDEYIYFILQIEI